jgi:hypothetical protein
MTQEKVCERFKTKFCLFFDKDIDNCQFKEGCSFAHSTSDIKVRLLHFLVQYNTNSKFYMIYFKTEWCPFNYEHNKALCFYAHNFQDFRRRPD